MQSKRQSLLESASNVTVGYIIAVSSQLLIFPLFGINISLMDNLMIGLYFTAISLVRGYVIRRWFNSNISTCTLDK